MSNPTVARTEEWYYVASDGLLSLQTHIGSGTRRPHLVSQDTWEEIHGMSVPAFVDYLKLKQEDHEVAATLALLATCEGAVRRDLQDRVVYKSTHHRELSSLAGRNGHVKLSEILTKWKKIVRKHRLAEAAIDDLITIYADVRNSLAHGSSAYNKIAFKLVLGKLRRIEKAWKNVVGDFRGFR